MEAALNTGIIPKLTDFGTQGTYFLEDIQRNPIAIFKPQDEEAFAYMIIIYCVVPIILEGIRVNFLHLA